MRILSLQPLLSLSSLLLTLSLLACHRSNSLGGEDGGTGSDTGSETDTESQDELLWARAKACAGR
jgi:hypothetical protein